jgi:hypothetical protein
MMEDVNEVEKMRDLLMKCLIKMGLPKENTILIASILKTENQIGIMLDYIRKHHKENPTKLEVTMMAERIYREVQ